MSSKHVVDLRRGKPPQKQTPRVSPRVFAPARREKRPSPLHRRRRKVRVIFACAALLLCVGAVWGVHLASYLPQFTIENVEVSGTDMLAPSLIESFVWAQLNDGSRHYFSRSNIFLFPKEVIQHALTASLPRVKAATLSLPTPLSRTLTVAVQERQPFALWCRSEASTSTGCYLMDEEGFIFAEAQQIPGDAPKTPYIFTGGLSGEAIGVPFIPGHMPGIIALLTILQQQDGFVPSKVRIESERDLTILFEEGFSLKLSFGEDAGTLARNLKLALSSEALRDRLDELEYVDLRFGDRVYYKLKGESAVEQ